MSKLKYWDLKYCKNCVHLCYEEVEPEVNKYICKELDSAMFDGESVDGQYCERRELRSKER